MLLRCRKVVALAGTHEGDDGDASRGGGVELEQTPRAVEHLLGLKEHNDV